jgi:hypothetical protein
MSVNASSAGTLTGEKPPMKRTSMPAVVPTATQTAAEASHVISA